MKIAKFPLLVFLQLVLASSHIVASPLVSIGDVADVYFTGSSSARWASNVFRNEDNEAEDIIFTVSPGVDVNIGRGSSDIDIMLSLSQDYIKYDEYADELDTEMFHIKAVGAYRSSRWDVSAIFSYDERQSNTGQANAVSTLIEAEDTLAKLDGEYRLSPKFSIGSGLSYTKKEYIKPEDLFANYDRILLPINLYYQWTPKVDLSVGYRYGLREVDSFNIFDGYDTTSHFLNVGARGSILPKLTGEFKFGYTLRDSGSTSGFTRDNSDGILGIDADLSWATTLKLTNKILLSRDFGVGGDGNATEVSSINFSSQYLLNNFWSASSYLGYTLRSYQDSNEREDDQYNATFNVRYAPNQYWSFSGGYQYSENKSNILGLSYVDHIFNISASLRY